VRKLIILAAAGGLCVVCGLVSGCGNSTAQQVTTVPVKKAAKPRRKAKRPSLSGLVAAVRNGVVRIEVRTCDQEFTGTGFLIGNRLVATVEHVVDGATSIRLVRGGRSLGSATVIGSDAARDLALLRTTHPIRGHTFRLASRPPVLGEDVAVLGFPLDLPLSLSKGLVSGSDRTIPIEGIERRKLVQTDAAVNHGNSGGPLISLKTGEVIGLVDIGTAEANGLAFAVSSQVAKSLLRAWALSPQPISAQSCAGSEPTSTVVAGSQPPQPTVDASAVEATVQTHWDLINAGDYAAAYEYFSPSFRARVSRQGWIDDKLRDRPSAYDTTFLGVSGDEEEADVQLQFETSGLETSPTNTGCNDWNGNYHLVKLNGRWLIDSSHLDRTPCG
jgi:serine protease Do